MIDDKWHEEVTSKIGGVDNYGKGITPNPYAPQEAEWARRKLHADTIRKLDEKIVALYEPRFITTPPTVELLAALITMVDAKQVLEVGMHTGFGALHMLRALVGKDGAKLTSIDARPAHDREFYAQPDIAKHFEFVEGWTPAILSTLHGRIFDFVFVDSAHDPVQTRIELEALMPITRVGTIFAFHDVPEWQTLHNPSPHPVRVWLENEIQVGRFKGLMLSSPNQLDCEAMYGVGYPKQLNPGLAMLMRVS